jgi:hypothetical protein
MRMRIVAKSASMLLLSSLLGVSEGIAGQCSNETPEGIKSNGIQGDIVSAIPLQGRIALTIKLSNITKNVAHLMAVGNTALSLNTGISLQKSTGETGINFCMHQASNAENLAECEERDAGELSNYSEIGGCESITPTLYFGFVSPQDIKSGNTINYSFKGIVRYSPPSTDFMLADKPPSPPRTVTLNFPPIPVR